MTDVLPYLGPLSVGSEGLQVELLQGLLRHAGYLPGPVDGYLGPRTAEAIRSFQAAQCKDKGVLLGIDVDTISGYDWDALTAPMRRAFAPLPKRMGMGDGVTRLGEGMFGLGDALVAVAVQHLRESPCELAGLGPGHKPNSGPWVYAYNAWLAERDKLPCECRDPHGVHRGLSTTCIDCDCLLYRPQWRLAWCAGFVSSVLRQACESLGLPMPLKGSLSCDVLARQAEKAGLLNTYWTPRPGDVFLVRSKDWSPNNRDWVHCGIVNRMHFNGGDPAASTIEGNTAEDGRREGTRVMMRLRRVDGLDFICWR